MSAQHFKSPALHIRRALFILLTTVLMLPSCHPFQKRALMGNWEGISLTEEGDSLALDPTEIQLEFLSKSRYTFQGTLKYKEEGTFRLEGGVLYTQDKNKSDKEEKAAEIKMLTRDSLHFRLTENGKERILKLKRVRKD